MKFGTEWQRDDASNRWQTLRHELGGHNGPPHEGRVDGRAGRKAVLDPESATPEGLLASNVGQRRIVEPPMFEFGSGTVRVSTMIPFGDKVAARLCVAQKPHRSSTRTLIESVDECDGVGVQFFHQMFDVGRVWHPYSKQIRTCSEHATQFSVHGFWSVKWRRRTHPPPHGHYVRVWCGRHAPLCAPPPRCAKYSCTSKTRVLKVCLRNDCHPHESCIAFHRRGSEAFDCNGGVSPS